MRQSFDQNQNASDLGIEHVEESALHLYEFAMDVDVEGLSRKSKNPEIYPTNCDSGSCTSCVGCMNCDSGTCVGCDGGGD